MRPGPKKPGESAAEYSARVKAMEQKFMGGGRPKTGGGASSGGGRGRGGATPPPGMMYGPNDALIPIPKKGGAATGGGRPVRVMGGSADKMGPVRGTAKGPAPMPGMKRGGTVKGKK